MSPWDTLGAETEIVRPPIRRRQPLGDLGTVATDDVRKFRKTVSPEPAKCIAKIAAAAHTAEVPLFGNLAISPDATVENTNEATRFWGAALAVRKYNQDVDTVIQRFQLSVDHAEMAFLSKQDAATFLNLLPNDFNSLANAILVKRAADTRVNVRKAHEFSKFYLIPIFS